MAQPHYRCCALTKSGTRCRAAAVAETDWWRCRKHIDWFDLSTAEERERLAVLEIEEAYAR